MNEIVCAGIHRQGAPVVVPNSLADNLLDRIASLPSSSLSNFIVNRANKFVSEKLLAVRPDIWRQVSFFSAPIKQDADVRLLVAIHSYGILPEEKRLQFVEALRRAAIDEGDDSFLEGAPIRLLIKDNEVEDILDEISTVILGSIDEYVDRVRSGWDTDYDPDDHFDILHRSLENIAEALADRVDKEELEETFNYSISQAVDEMRNEYYQSIDQTQDEHWPVISSGVSLQQSQADSLSALFRDVSD